MRKLIQNWYQLAVYLAGGYALLLGLGSWTVQQRALLMGLILLHLHFFEEFGFPGGFAWMGIRVEMWAVPPVVADWPLNQLSAFFGNEWFALVVYLLPLLCPWWHWLVLAALVFAFAELVMHALVFNLAMRTAYNPGLVTALGLTLVTSWYLWDRGGVAAFTWLDLALAIGWIGLNYWLAFRSPLFDWFNCQRAYTFRPADLAKSAPYLKKEGRTLADYRFPGDEPKGD